MRRFSLLVIIAILVCTGCATKKPFMYEDSVNTSSIPKTNLTVSVNSIQDKREDEKKIDEIYESDPITEIQSIITKELVSTGLFSLVTGLPDPNENQNKKMDILITPSLLKMDWYVPDYEAIIGSAFVVSALTGGIGGAIYGSTETDVYGNIKFHVKILDNKTNEIILDQTYEGSYEEKLAKFSCDTPETKSRVVGKSLKLAIEKFKKDLTNIYSKI